VQALLRGGRACVFYGAAQFSRGVDLTLLAVEDLVQAKKTQRSKDWPIIEALVTGHYHATRTEPTAERIRFWLVEARARGGPNSG
jgi:hypothetical protein